MSTTDHISFFNQSTGENMSADLKRVSAYISENNKAGLDLPLCVIAVGEIVSVFYLMRRAGIPAPDALSYTGIYNIDFHTADLVATELLLAAARHVAVQQGLQAEWLDNRMDSVLEGDPSYDNVEEESLMQNVVLYSSKELMVYAGDWKYQLTRLLWTSLDAGRTERELTDAAGILHLFVTQNNGKPLSKDVIKGWYATNEYLTDEMFEVVAERYVQIYQRAGIQ